MIAHFHSGCVSQTQKSSIFTLHGLNFFLEREEKIIRIKIVLIITVFRIFHAIFFSLGGGKKRTQTELLKFGAGWVLRWLLCFFGELITNNNLIVPFKYGFSAYFLFLHLPLTYFHQLWFEWDAFTEISNTHSNEIMFDSEIKALKPWKRPDHISAEYRVLR